MLSMRLLFNRTTGSGCILLYWVKKKIIFDNGHRLHKLQVVPVFLWNRFYLYKGCAP